MGTLRLILAVAVIAAHVGPLFGLRFFGGGVMAVEAFYMLSGFYMALVLSTRYRGRLRDFYFNRFLRLYPTYWLLLTVFLATSAAYWLLVGHPLGALSFWAADPSFLFQLWAGFSNVTMLGCDWAELYSYVTHTGDQGVNRLIVIQPTWSISIEICFYLMAPFVLRLRRRKQFALFLAAVLIRAGIWYGAGGQWSHWLYYFAPPTWSLFLAGVFSYHLMTWLETVPAIVRIAVPTGRVLAVVIAAIVVFYAQMDLLKFQDWRFYLMIALGMPFVFTAFRDDQWDNALAAWSYPMYLAHWVVLALYAPLRHYVPPDTKPYVVLVLTLALSYAVVRFDRIVQQRFKHKI